MADKSEIQQLSVEERHKMAAGALEKNQWYVMSGLIKEGIDPRIILKVSTDVHKSGGELMGKSFKKRLVLGDDAESVIKGHAAMLDVMGFKYDIVERTKKRARLRITKCTNWETIQKLQLEKAASGKELCAPCKAVTEAFCKAISPDITLTWPKCFLRGNSTCEIEYKAKIDR